MVEPDALPRDEQDELEELPPLDGDSRDQPDAEPDYADLLEDDEEEATLDDATGEDDPPDTNELDLNGRENGWLEEAGEAQDLDLGTMTMLDFGNEGSKADDADEAGGGEEDFGLIDAPERGGLDAGDEGPLDPDEELREADLPALDADEEGEVDDTALVDSAFASDEPLGLPWAAEPWLRVGAPVALVGATAVACAARGALVAGRYEAGSAEILLVDLEGTCERLAADGLDAAQVRVLSVEGPTVAAIAQQGRLLVSRDSGARFLPFADPISDVAASDAVLASGALWLCTRAGGLLVGATTADARPRGIAGQGPPTVQRCAVPGAAAALTRDVGGGTGGVAVLVTDEAGRPTALVRGAAGSPIRREVIDAPDARSPALFAARGDHVAYAARRGGVVRRAAAGLWTPFEWEGRVTAIAFVDDAGTLVAATYSDGDDTTALVRLDAAGNASVVARLGGGQADADADGRAMALAHDEARGVVWVAGGFGVAAFAIR
jgi:hypothetical protein